MLPRTRCKFSFVIEKLAPGLIFLAFLITRLPYHSFYSDWDEIGFVSAAAWLDQGYEPYRDFSIGHPPLWLWTVVWLWRVLGLSDPWSKYYMAKALSVFSVAVTGVILYFVAERVYSSKISGIIASALFFTSFNSFYYGVTAAPEYYAVMLTMISVALFLLGHRLSVFLSSLVLGLAVMSRYSVAPLVFVLVASAASRAKLGKDWMLFPLALLGLAIPTLSTFLSYGNSAFYASSGYVTLGSVQPVSLSEKFHGYQSAIYTPLYLFAPLGLLPFLLVKRDWRKYFILLSLLSTISPCFVLPAEPHRLIESEPLASIIGAAVVALATKQSKIRSGSWHISNSVHLVWVVTTLIVLSLLLASTGLLAVPRVNACIEKITDETRNVNLRLIVRSVNEHTKPSDYVICGYPLIAFLADRKMPALPWGTNLTELSVRYDVELVTIGAGYSPQYFEDYVRKNYVLLQNFPYWGSLYVKKH